MKKLGRLTKVDLRSIWLSESTDFTPWLAKEENLHILSETLSIELELEAQEKNVGPFRADILCKDVGKDEWVLIENQLEKTDHSHLGQLLTYASGLDAVTIIWVAAKFNDEHRSTMDWLNKITDESFRFFGLEVELWSIGDSLAAPKFNIVSKPNNWSKSVARAARAIDKGDLTETQILQLEFWGGLHNVLIKMDGPVNGNRKPQPQSWMSYSIGRSKFSVNATRASSKNQIGAELYITGSDAKAYFHLLKDEKEKIEQEIGYSLEWHELPDGMDTKIAIYNRPVNSDNRSKWPEQHEWLGQKLNELHRVFSQRVKNLQAEDWVAPSI